MSYKLKGIAANGASQMTWPDRVAVNGPAMNAQARNAGYPADRMVDVEALRYTYLLQDLVAARTRGVPRVLVSGEYSPTADEYLMTQFSQALDIEDPQILVSVRPHPAASGRPISLDPRLRLDEHASAFEALNAADATVCIGNRTLLIADPHVIMTSPAEGLRQVELFRTPRKLAQALHHVKRQDVTSLTKSARVFCLDPKIPRWRGLVSPSIKAK